jgi:hypothetical protein
MPSISLACLLVGKGLDIQCTAVSMVVSCVNIFHIYGQQGRTTALLCILERHYLVGCEHIIPRLGPVRRSLA